MPTVAVIVGLLLLAVGVGGFAAAGFASKALTALIPAGFGLLIALCGILASRKRLRKPALHTAAGLALIGFLLPAGRLAMVISRGDFTWKLATVMLGVAAVICLGFLGLSLKSCVETRREKDG